MREEDDVGCVHCWCDTLRCFVGFEFFEFICGIVVEDLEMHMDFMKGS